MQQQRRERDNVLADKKDINGSKVEVIEIGHGRHAFSASMHTSIKLYVQLAKVS